MRSRGCLCEVDCYIGSRCSPHRAGQILESRRWRQAVSLVNPPLRTRRPKPNNQPTPAVSPSKTQPVPTAPRETRRGTLADSSDQLILETSSRRGMRPDQVVRWFDSYGIPSWLPLHVGRMTKSKRYVFYGSRFPSCVPPCGSCASFRIAIPSACIAPDTGTE